MSETQTLRSKKEVLPPVVIDVDGTQIVKVCMTIPLGAAPSFLKELSVRDSEEERLHGRLPGRQVTLERPLRNVGLGSAIPNEMILHRVSVDYLELTNGMRMKVIMTFVSRNSSTGEQDEVCRLTQAWLNRGFYQEAFNEAKIFINPLHEDGEETVIELRGHSGRKNSGITFGIEK